MTRHLRCALPFVLCSAATVQAAGDTGWFVTAQYGGADYDVLLEGDRAWWGRADDDAGTWAAGLGYTLAPWLGLRLMYERTHDLSVQNQCPDGLVCAGVTFRRSADAANWSLAALPRLPLGDRWELYGTLGAMRWKIDPGGGRERQIASDDDTTTLYGGGIGYSFRNGAGVALEHQRSGADYSALRLGLTYSFR